MKRETRRKPPRQGFSVRELLVIVAIITTLTAILLPAVEQARSSRNQPSIFPWLLPLFDSYPLLFVVGMPLIAVACTVTVGVLLRAALPASIREHFSWNPKPKVPAAPVPAPEPIADSRPALALLIVSLVLMAVLVLVAFHVHIDASHRRKVFTWNGPLGNWAGTAALVAAVLSGANIWLGSYVFTRFRTKSHDLTIASIAVSVLNLAGYLAGSFLLFVAMED